MKVVRALLVCTLQLSLVPAAVALNPDRDIHQLAHRSFGEKDGYPGRTQALAQTTDGFLWVGSDVGLFRFDGVHFERFKATSGDPLSEDTVHSLLALPDGSLWIAYGTGSYGNGNRICVLRNGNVKSYGNADGVTSIPTAIVQDHEGTVWANTETGVIRFDGTRWEHIGKDWNFPEDVPRITSTALFVDSHGTVWVGVNQTVLYLKQGSKRFEPTGAFAGWSVSIAEAPDGTIWLADNGSFVRAISTSVSAKSAATAKCEFESPQGKSAKCPSEDPLVIKIATANNLIFDRNGSLWITTDTFGLGRIPHPERLGNQPSSKNDDALQRFAANDGLSADNGSPILEDREGNIWVATRDGLDQFRDTALVPVVLPTSLVQIGIAPADRGDIWVTGSWNYVALVHGDSAGAPLIRFEAFKPYRDPAGATWMLSNSLGQFKDGKFRRVAQSPEGLSGSLGAWDVAGDKLGTLWAFSNGYGFFSLDHDRWKSWATPPEVTKQRVADMFSDSAGLIWVSTYDGDIITMDRGVVVDHLVKADNPLRYVLAFAEHAPHEIWAGGAGGLGLIDRGHLRDLRPAAVDSLYEVTGIVDAGSDGLWLNTAARVIHVSKDEEDRALRDPSYRFKVQEFDVFDGLPGRTQAMEPFPKAIQGTDGRIWFSATRGVAWVDPKYIPRNAVPPPISITSVSADGARYPRLADLRLPAHTANVQIDYSALSLSVPERVRFRYKLEGVDRDWQEPGARRQAFYTRLAPGKYRFRVIACNNDGVWNEAGAFLDFSVAPAYYQTAWFRGLCVAALVALISALYRMRLYQLRRQHEASNQARLELTHVARLATLSTMTASITHEVSQPLSGIITNSNTCARMLAADPPNIAGAAETVRRTLRDANRASEVIKHLRAMFAKKAPTMEMVDLNDLVREVIALSSAELRQSGAILQMDFAERLPAIRGDRVQLQQVILNLLLNAVDAMAGIDDRPRTLRVRTEVEGGDRVRLLVRDSGVGLDPRGLEKLFEAFYTTKAHGLGVGLAISRSIIESHKGKLWAMANDGPGATFVFSIPCASDTVIDTAPIVL
jgi:signal transduction histidine kinase/ligand-binding sensor domain-containing protein